MKYKKKKEIVKKNNKLFKTTRSKFMNFLRSSFMQSIFYSKYSRILKNRIHIKKLKSFYSVANPISNISNKIYIFMCDGHIHHGGLGDRLSGLVSTYAYCKYSGKNFKAYWVHPYKLENFLIPNKYDWRISSEQVFYNPNCSTPVLISYNPSVRVQQRYAKNILKKINLPQCHVYTNMKYAYPQNYKFLFNELFRPSERLQKAIDNELKYLPKEYISVTFRFQQLLGDFEENDFPILKSNEDQDRLIKLCIKYIEAIHKKNPKYERILVTSDSSTFLKNIQSYEYIHTIKGEVVHLDYNSKDVELATHMKSFVDLFMIAKAKKIYSIIIPPLFRTGFPWFASLIYGHEFIEVDSEYIK